MIRAKFKEQVVQVEPEQADVVILCGGRGTRLAPDTDIIPKPLVNVGGRAILWHIMAHYASYGFKRFILCLGYRGDLIREYFLNYHLRTNDFTLSMNGGAPRIVQHTSDGLDWEITFAETGLNAQTGARCSGSAVTSARRTFTVRMVTASVTST